MRMNDVIRKAVTVKPQDTAVTAARAMRDTQATSCLVMDSDNVVGTLSEHDLVAKLVAEDMIPATVLVSEVMASVPSTPRGLQDRIVDLLGTPASTLEDAEGVYELALTGAPIDFTVLPGAE